MTSTGTYSYSPSLGELGIYAFHLIGIRPTQLLQEHMQSLQTAAQMVLSRWSAQGVNLWKVELVTVPLVQGTATYSVDPSVVVILDLYVTVTNGSVSTNRYILPISRTEYASYANITQQGFPTTYWHDRLLAPTVTFWPVPDGNEVSFSYYPMQQIQDAALGNQATMDIPYYWLEAMAYALAYRLALIWAPPQVQILKPLADEAYQIAAAQNVETAQQYLSPILSSYFRT